MSHSIHICLSPSFVTLCGCYIFLHFSFTFDIASTTSANLIHPLLNLIPIVDILFPSSTYMALYLNIELFLNLETHSSLF